MLKDIHCFILYIFGNVVARHFYGDSIFKSRHFASFRSIGWRWLCVCFFMQKILGINRHVPWPVSPRNIIGDARNIVFDADDLNNFMMGGCYFQAYGARIVIGKGTYIAPNVGLITQNHDIADLSIRSEAKDIIIGCNCWIGMNSVVLPGVILGDNTIVGAGAVVTKSFPKGNIVIGGVPAVSIRC